MEYWIERNAPLGSRFRYKKDGTTYRVKDYRFHDTIYRWPPYAIILEPETVEERERLEEHVLSSHLSVFFTRLPYDDDV